MSKRISGIVLLIMITGCLAVLRSEDPENISVKDKRLNFYMDLTRLRYSDSLTYVEFPIDMYRDQLEFVKQEDGYQAEFLVTAEILAQDSLIERKHWRTIDHCGALDEITNSQRLYNKNYFLLPEGEYTFRLEVEDPNRGSKGQLAFEFAVNPFTPGTIRVSDMQLASSIQRDTSRTLYTKNGFLVIPNPSALYGVGLPVLAGYSEIYNLEPATSDSGQIFQIKYDILNEKGEVIRSQTQEKKKPGLSAVNITQINVVNLISGTYTLVMEIKDLENGDIASTYRKFTVYRQADYDEGGELYGKEQSKDYIYGDTEIDGMTEEELDQEFEYARYLATSVEKKTYKKANLEGKRELLKQFWNTRTLAADHLKEGENFRTDYLGRVDMANQMFRGSFKEGWKTDRGRILLVYGKPDDIERMTFGMGQKSHEIWHYHSLQGGVQFVFVDKQELGDMELVHSTARGELYDDNWTRWLE
jgi:GWxTD domain-containing protein